jgi:hypothetical protein
MMMPSFGKRVDVPGGRRRASRQPVLLAASAVTLGGSQSVIVEDVCSTGARLRGRNLPVGGKQLMIKVGGMNILAEVAWSGSEECGITFDAPLDQDGVQTLKHEGRWATLAR